MMFCFFTILGQQETYVCVAYQIETEAAVCTWLFFRLYIWTIKSTIQQLSIVEYLN
jgi:hypothetical protein